MKKKKTLSRFTAIKIINFQRRMFNTVIYNFRCISAETFYHYSEKKKGYL